MKENMDKSQTTAHGSCCFEHCRPPVRHASSTATSATFRHLLRFGAVALIVGAVLMLCASMAALYLWKVSDKNVYNVRYSMNINGEVREGSMEIDSDNNLERFKMGSGAEEAVEIHDFQTGITGILFFGGDKCYIKSQIKARLPHMGVRKLQIGAKTKSRLPFDDELLFWVAEEQPLKDTRFLSSKILELCGELPIYWLQPMHSKAAEVRDPMNHTVRDTSRAAEEEEEEDGAQASAGSAYNPENPYHVSQEGAVTFDTMLDHQGICCSECQRSYTHCQRVCEPLRGYWPWPYNYRGCQVACRVIMPCRWWVARILGLV
uniref:Leukocyte cell-derived chemotaxin 1 n=1 Tax=Salarias fasciatus TaxID=181472 RepID=A0A672JT87_SALFA